MTINKKTLATGMATMAALAVLPASAFGAQATVDGIISGGTLTLDTTAAPSFSATLNGTDQNKTYTLPTTVTDARGNRAGWNLTITSTQFSTGVLGRTLATNASTITGVANSCVSGSTCTDPVNAVTYPVGVPAGAIAPTAVKYFNAAADTGMGKFTNTPTMNVFLPANTDAGSYSSTLTVSVVSGP